METTAHPRGGCYCHRQLSRLLKTPDRRTPHSAVVPVLIVLVTISAIEHRFLGSVSRETSSAPETDRSIPVSIPLQYILPDSIDSFGPTPVHFRPNLLTASNHSIRQEGCYCPPDAAVGGKPSERACFTWNSGRTDTDTAL